MPALLPADFPAAEILRGEGLTTLLLGAAEADATIGFINLMPNKVDTEVDFLRLINASGRNVEFVPIKMVTHKSRHAPAEHLERFYSAFDDVACRLDGVIITGAPLDDVAFEDVTYWREITAIMDWLHERRTPIYNICWGAFAALYHWWGIGMHRRDRKISGVYVNRLTDSQSPLMRGIADGFSVPFSRFVTWLDEEVDANEATVVVARGQEQGPFVVASRTHPEYFITGHPEYSALTLHNEYHRDLGRGMNPSLPENYYPENDPAQAPEATWKPIGEAMMRNWIEEVIEYKQQRHD